MEIVENGNYEKWKLWKMEIVENRNCEKWKLWKMEIVVIDNTIMLEIQDMINSFVMDIGKHTKGRIWYQIKTSNVVGLSDTALIN